MTLYVNDPSVVGCRCRTGGRRGCRPPRESPSARSALMAFSRTLPEVPKLEQWRVHASCRSIDPDLFFPVGTTGSAVDQIEYAKRVCAICPVSEPCLEFALTTNQDSGIWGGRSEEERRVLRRQWLRRRRAASAAV